MKKKIFYGIITITTLMSFAACNNENDENSDSQKNHNATVTISLLNSFSRASEGKESAKGDESKISGFEAYTFNSSNQLTGYASTSGTTASLMAEEGSGNTVVVIVNASPKIGRYSIGSTDYTLELLEKLAGSHTFTMDPTNSTPDVPNEGFLMSGIQKNLTFNEGVNTIDDFAVKRLVSKFDNPTINPLATGFMSIPDSKLQKLFGANATAENTTFEYQARALANGIEQSYIFKQSTWKRPFHYLTSDFDTTTGEYKENGVYSGTFLEKDNNNPIYVYENYPIADYIHDGVTGYHPLEVYCFIIKGILKNTDGDDSGNKTRYWRVNLVKETGSLGNLTQENYSVRRNGVYKVSIDALKTIGYENAKEAEEETPVIPEIGSSSVNITVSVDEWDIYKTSSEM